MAGLVIVASLLFLTYLFSGLKSGGITSNSLSNGNPSSETSQDATWYNQDNIVARSMSQMLGDFGSGASTVVGTIGSSVRGIGSISVAVTKAVGRTVYSGIAATGRGIASATTFIGRSVARSTGRVWRSAFVSSTIRPTASAESPTIDPHAAALLAIEHTLSTLPDPANENSHSSGVVTTSWPIHGRVTTLFGVPHWPYQPTHTGLDISSGNASGRTGVLPYLPGKVKETIYSSRGLGNHVIVDHGNGVTSVYAHLATIKVQREQDVTKDTILGYEGSTGASTGTHLHFEIRINDQPVNPKQYVSGQP